MSDLAIVEYLDRRLGPHRGQGPEYHYHCPACLERRGSESNARKLDVHAAKRVCSCFRCGFKGSIAQLFRRMNGGFLSMEEAKLLRTEPNVPSSGLVADELRRMFSHATASSMSLRPVPPPEETIWIADASPAERMVGHARRYLASRGLPADRIASFGIGYCPIGRYAGMLVFPVRQGGEIVYFTTRFADDGHRVKSKNPLSLEGGFFTKSDCLLNFDAVLGLPTIALVEGPFDCMAFGDDPVPPAVASLGKDLSEAQLRLFDSLVLFGLREVVVAYDAGTGAETDEAVQALVHRVPTVTVLPLEHGDPYDRRAELPALMSQRSLPTLSARLRSRFVHGK